VDGEHLLTCSRPGALNGHQQPTRCAPGPNPRPDTNVEDRAKLSRHSTRWSTERLPVDAVDVSMPTSDVLVGYSQKRSMWNNISLSSRSLYGMPTNFADYITNERWRELVSKESNAASSVSFWGSNDHIGTLIGFTAMICINSFFWSDFPPTTSPHSPHPPSPV